MKKTQLNWKEKYEKRLCRTAHSLIQASTSTHQQEEE